MLILNIIFIVLSDIILAQSIPQDSISTSIYRNNVNSQLDSESRDPFIDHKEDCSQTSPGVLRKRYPSVCPLTIQIKPLKNEIHNILPAMRSFVKKMLRHNPSFSCPIEPSSDRKVLLTCTGPEIQGLPPIYAVINCDQGEYYY